MPCCAKRGSASLRDARPSGLPARFTAASGPRQALAASGAASATWLRARPSVVSAVKPASGRRSAIWLSGSTSSSKLTASSRPSRRMIASRWSPWCRSVRSLCRSPRTTASERPLPKQALSRSASTGSTMGAGVCEAAQSSTMARPVASQCALRLCTGSLRLRPLLSTDVAVGVSASSEEEKRAVFLSRKALHCVFVALNWPLHDNGTVVVG